MFGLKKLIEAINNLESQLKILNNFKVLELKMFENEVEKDHSTPQQRQMHTLWRRKFNGYLDSISYVEPKLKDLYKVEDKK